MNYDNWEEVVKTLKEIMNDNMKNNKNEKDINNYNYNKISDYAGSKYYKRETPNIDEENNNINKLRKLIEVIQQLRDNNNFSQKHDALYRILIDTIESNSKRDILYEVSLNDLLCDKLIGIVNSNSKNTIETITEKIMTSSEHQEHIKNCVQEEVRRIISKILTESQIKAIAEKIIIESLKSHTNNYLE